MPREPLLYAFTLIRDSLMAFNPRKPWPPAMAELQRLIFEEHPELVERSPALQWAQKAVQPWPTCDHWREHEREEFLRRAVAAATGEEAGW
jgi:hypothetical protein